MILYFLIFQLPFNSILYIYIDDIHLEWYKRKSYLISLLIAYSLELITTLYFSFDKLTHITTIVGYLLENIGYILIFTLIIILCQFFINKWIMNTSNKKSKWVAWVITIQTLLILFFFLFAVVAKQEADRNMELALKNEKKAEQQVKIALEAKKIAEEQISRAMREKEIAEEQKLKVEILTRKLMLVTRKSSK